MLVSDFAHISYLGQTPRSLPSLQPNALKDTFIHVARAYDAGKLAMTTAKTGYNFDVALKEVEHARGVRDRARKLLRKAKDEGLITRSEEVDIELNVMLPLTSALQGAYDTIRKRSTSWVLRYWGAFEDSAIKIVAGTTGFFGERWEKIARTYRILSDYTERGTALLEQIKQPPVVPGTEKVIASYGLTLEKMKAAKRKIESDMAKYDVPLKALQESAAEQPGLGAAQIMAVPVVTVLGWTITVGMIASFVIEMLLFEIIWQFGAAVVDLSYLEGLTANESKALLAKGERQTERIRAALAEREKLLKQGIALSEKTGETLVGMTPKVTDKEFKDKIQEDKKKIDEQRAAEGKPPVVYKPETPVFTYLLGAGAAVGILYLFLSKK